MFYLKQKLTRLHYNDQSINAVKRTIIAYSKKHTKCMNILFEQNLVSSLI